ncbi:MAG: histidinol dehydrogenase [Deltaproteobacteria bacterium]|nr:histidinol dehydrogenase [Deltaproteobacteria bacterium]
MKMIRRISTNDSSIDNILPLVTSSREENAAHGMRKDYQVHQTVTGIKLAIQDRGDRAVKDYTREFDRIDFDKDNVSLEVSKKEVNAAFRKVSKDDMRLLELAASRIEAFHKRQYKNLCRSWTFNDKYGNRLGQRVTPIEKVGIYVPGGKAAYPSTVLMNAIPAKVAGVDTIVMVTPPGKDGINPYVLAAARIARVDRVFRIGGAQSICALAYGTETIPKVDKITGPGNIYVATAKQLVYGDVGIDMIAGPSEIVIINDGSGNPSWMAWDMLSQAEHDEMASSILITTSKEMADGVEKGINSHLSSNAMRRRKGIAESSLKNFGAIIEARDLDEAAEISNRLAPEHLELFVKRPDALLRKIKNAGAIFLGPNTPEAAGDYLAGPNHTLPTGGTARFSSPLGVEDFIKRTSVIGFSAEGIDRLGDSIKRFAGIEGLEAHGLSAAARREKSKI